MRDAMNTAARSAARRWPLRRRIAAGVARPGWRWACLLAGCCPRTLFARAAVVRDRGARRHPALGAHRGRWPVALSAGRGTCRTKFRRALLVFEDKRFEQHSGVDGSRSRGRRGSTCDAGRVVSGGSTLTHAAGAAARAATTPTTHVAREARRGRAGAAARDGLRQGANCWRCMPATRRSAATWWDSRRPRGGTSAAIPRRCRGPRRRRSRCCPTTPRWCISSAIARGSQAKRDFLLRRLHEAGDLDALDLDLALTEPLAAEPHDLPDLAPHLLDTLRAQNPARHRVRHHARCAPAGRRPRSSCASTPRSRAAERPQRRGHGRRQRDVRGAGLRRQLVMGTFPFPAKGDAPAQALPFRNGNVPRGTPSTSSAGRAARAASSSRCCTPRCSRTARSRRACCCPTCPTHYEGFTPENFDRQYRGAVRADEALAHSLNIPAVRMLKTYGVARFADLLRDAGMSTLTRPADDYGLTLILGGAEGNLWDITGMYASLAGIARAGPADRDAALPRARRVLAATDPRARGPTPIGAGAAWLTLDALLEVPRPGEEGHWRSFADEPRASPGRPARAGACATAGPWATPAATRSACGWATPAAKAARASPARPWPRR